VVCAIQADQKLEDAVDEIVAILRKKPFNDRECAELDFTASAGMVIMTAIGGENIAITIEGRERYPINVRYGRELRNDIGRLSRVLVPTKSGAQIPLAQLADIRLNEGPAMIIVEHKLQWLMKIVDRIIVLHRGQILADGKPEEIKQNEDVKKVYLGEEILWEKV
jgi:hypothetical protein